MSESHAALVSSMVMKQSIIRLVVDTMGIAPPSHSEMASLAMLLTARRSSPTSLEKRPRDPRAAPVSIHRNVSISETCAYYGVQDAISHCRVPRSCRDCLAKPGCVLSGDGSCQDASLYKAERDYRNATFTNTSLVSTASNFDFLAGSAPYCDANDAVCTKCRDGFKQLGRTREAAKQLQTQLCRGDGGCVCVGLCEVPEAWAARVYDLNCSQPSPVMRDQQRRKLKQFMSSSRDPRASPVHAVNRRADAESCELSAVQDVQGCRRPRTCRECLLKPNCALVEAQCVGIDKYDPSKDYRVTVLNSTNSTSFFHMGGAQFASANATYCSADDPVCATCGDAFRRSIAATYTMGQLVQDADFCIGKAGCVCLEACDSVVWSSGAYDSTCSLLAGNTVNTQTVFTQLALALGVWVVCLFLYGRYGQEDEETRGSDHDGTIEMRRNMLDAAPAPGRLDLFGWRAFYDRLLQKEQELLLGVEDDHALSPVLHPVDFLFLPTAPDFDDDDSSAPTTNDPHALASAPVFRAARDAEEETAKDPLTSEPSAPDIDEHDPVDWMADSRSGALRGTVTRRSRRID